MPAADFTPTPQIVQAAADSTGKCVCTFRPPSQCRVMQVGVEMPGATAAVGAIRFNGALVTPFVATADAPGGPPYVPVGPGDLFTAEWTGATPGAIGKALFLWDFGTTSA